jgi:hypothetical protein
MKPCSAQQLNQAIISQSDGELVAWSNCAAQSNDYVQSSNKSQLSTGSNTVLWQHLLQGWSLSGRTGASIHARRTNATHLPKDLDSIIHQYAYTRIYNMIQGMLLAMGMILWRFLAPPIRYRLKCGNCFDEWRKGFWTTRARGQRLDSVLFSQSDNRHITTSMWTVPISFTASFPPHFTCFACIMKWTTDDSWYRWHSLSCEDKEW